MLDRIALVLATAGLASACGPPPLQQAEVVEMLLGKPRGLLGGFELGDSWESIKAEHDPRYSVRDDEFKQLRRDLSDPGEEGFFVTFQLEGDTVRSISADVYGSKDNAAVIRRLFDDFMAHFDQKLGELGKCGPAGKGSLDCTWDSADKRLRVQLGLFQFADPISAHLDAQVMPLEKP